MTKHFENCEAPICADDHNPNFKGEVVWYPGESICSKSPMQKFQRNQRRINKLIKKETFKNPDLYFTANTLEKIGRVTNSTKGQKP